MPAVRTLKGKRSGEDAFQLTWTAPTPQEPASEPAMSFSFAPNVTPCTFIAPPPSEDEEIPSEESSLFPEPLDGMPELLPPPTSTKRRKKSSKSSTLSSEDGTPIDGDDSNSSGTPAHIPRPPNAFILFRSSFIRSQHVSAQIEGNHGTLSKIVGMVWHSLPFREREVWQAKARKALAEHKRKYPGYSFRPAKDKTKGGANGGGGVNSGGNGTGGDEDKSAGKRDGSAVPPATTKRKQREVGPRDVARCEQIAALLSKGLKGKALEEAIAEFDASRAPVVITPRFEVPITAQQFESGNGATAPLIKQEEVCDERPSVRKYRRSSSAPLLEADHSKAAQFMRIDPPASLFSTSPFSASRPRPQSTSASPPTPTAAQIPSNNSSTPTFRAQRKRSTSSSPPMRHRTLQAQASLPSMNIYHQQPPQLTLTTALSSAQLQAYQASQPLSAPVLARQDASSPLSSAASASSSMMYGQEDVFFDYDSSNPMQWYSPAPSAVDVSTAGFGGAQDNWEFNNFHFTTTSASGSSPIKPSPLSECYSPFQQAPSSSSVASQDGSVVDPTMPMLVERPYELDQQQQLPAPIPQQHPHALHIQTTNLNWTDFSTSASSPMDGYALPHHSQQHFGGYDGSSQGPSQHQALTPYDYASTNGGCSPTSPASECVSVQETHTPREGSADIFASSASSTGGSASGFSFDVNGGYYAPAGEQKMMQPQHHNGLMPIDMDALNGALAPYMQA